MIKSIKRAFVIFFPHFFLGVLLFSELDSILVVGKGGGLVVDSSNSLGLVVDSSLDLLSGVDSSLLYGVDGGGEVVRVSEQSLKNLDENREDGAGDGTEKEKGSSDGPVSSLDAFNDEEPLDVVMHVPQARYQFASSPAFLAESLRS